MVTVRTVVASIVVSNSQTKDLARVPLIVALYNTSMTKKRWKPRIVKRGSRIEEWYKERWSCALMAASPSQSSLYESSHLIVHTRNNNKTTILEQLNPQINTMRFSSAITAAALSFSSLASAITGP
jgi:hypothetical protein